jgi:lipoprotein NlpI
MHHWINIGLLGVLGTLVGGSTAMLRGEDFEAAWKRARSQIESGKYGDAERSLTMTIKSDPKFALAHYYRGRIRFRLSKFAASVLDFDRYLKLAPMRASRQWERGIACYYAEQFEAGAEQFQLYQTYHDNDVENSVWRFLCMAQTAGVEKARAAMLPIRDDRRIPMMAIYDLFRGEASPWDVEAAVVSGDPDPNALAYRRFYAQLYLGLYYEAVGNEALAKDAILDAADNYEKAPRINNYMWAVADVHAKRLRAASAEAGKSAEEGQ